MNQFVALSLTDRTKVDEAVRALRKMHSEHSNTLYASALVTKDAGGNLSVQEITKEGNGETAVGALIGALSGLPAGPAAAAIMAAGGAVIGRAAYLTIQGHFTEFAGRIAQQVPAGGAMIVADVAEDGLSRFQAIMQGMGGSVSFTQESS